MISSVDIRGLRGIANGSASGLTRLVVLLGANGSGKSTVLDALMMGGSFHPGRAIGRAVMRRAAPHSSARWLFYGSQTKASILVSSDASIGNVPRATELEWHDQFFARTFASTVIPSPIGAIAVSVSERGGAGRRIADPMVVFGDDDQFEARETVNEKRMEPALRSLIRDVSLVDMRGVAVTPDLTDVLTEAKQSGRAEAAVDLLRSVIPDLVNLEILKLGQRFGVAMVSKTGAVPVAMSGDGVRSLARLALSLAAAADGLVLLEEPEVHQHPAAIKQSARAIVEATRRGVQVVLTTHSLDLVDALIAASTTAEELAHLSVQRLRMVNANLQSTVFVGEEIARMRGELEMELR